MIRIIPLALLAAALPFTASAQLMCGPRAPLVETLASQYQERQAYLGLTKEAQVMEIWVSEIGTWTLLVTLPSGVTCLTASGNGFDVVPPTAEPGDPS